MFRLLAFWGAFKQAKTAMNLERSFAKAATKGGFIPAYVFLCFPSFSIYYNIPFNSLSLCKRLMQAVLSAHDTVAQKKFDPVLPPLPDDLDDDLEEESVKIVRLVKNKEPLVRFTPKAEDVTD